MVDTWLNPAFPPSHTNTIALKLNANARPVDVETGKLLENELQQEGFTLAPEAQADYLLSFVVSDNVEEHVLANNAATQSAPPSSPPVDQPGLVYSYSSVEKSYYIHTHDLRLFLYTNPRTNPSGLQLAWQGAITLGKIKSAGDMQTVLKTLLHYFGGQQNGKVALVQ